MVHHITQWSIGGNPTYASFLFPQIIQLACTHNSHHSILCQNCIWDVCTTLSRTSWQILSNTPWVRRGAYPWIKALSCGHNSSSLNLFIFLETLAITRTAILIFVESFLSKFRVASIFWDSEPFWSNNFNRLEFLAISKRIFSSACTRNIAVKEKNTV